MASGRLSLFISTLFYIGYIPVAPGTVGTLVAFLLYGLLKPSFHVQVILIPFTYLVGVFTAQKTETILQESDSPRIVIDEFLGYMVSVFMLDMTWRNLVVAFILFRIFDILKPFPIKYIEKRLRGGYAIMTDDIIAGIYTGIFMRLLVIL